MTIELIYIHIILAQNFFTKMGYTTHILICVNVIKCVVWSKAPSLPFHILCSHFFFIKNINHRRYTFRICFFFFLLFSSSPSAISIITAHQRLDNGFITHQTIFLWYRMCTYKRIMYWHHTCVVVWCVCVCVCLFENVLIKSQTKVCSKYLYRCVSNRSQPKKKKRTKFTV